MQGNLILKAFKETAESISYDITSEDEENMSGMIQETINNWKDELNKPIVPKDISNEFVGQLIDILEDKLSKCDPNAIIISDRTYGLLKDKITQAVLSEKYQ